MNRNNPPLRTFSRMIAHVGVMVCLSSRVPHSRGQAVSRPHGQATAAAEPAIEWAPRKRRVKTPINGEWPISPIILDGRIYLTTAVDIPVPRIFLTGAVLESASGRCFGKEVFLQDGASRRRFIQNSHASPTPLTDGKHLFVHFGHQGTACLDLNGTIVWKSTEHRHPVHGNGGTPSSQVTSSSSPMAATPRTSSPSISDGQDGGRRRETSRR